MPIPQQRCLVTRSRLLYVSRPLASTNYTLQRESWCLPQLRGSSGSLTVCLQLPRSPSRLLLKPTTRQPPSPTRVTACTTTMVSVSNIGVENVTMIGTIVGANGGNAKSPRFFQLYMGHDDEVTLSLLERAWKSGFDVLMLTTDTWQLGWRPTDINIANYMYVCCFSASVYDLSMDDQKFLLRRDRR